MTARSDELQKGATLDGVSALFRFRILSCFGDSRQAAIKYLVSCLMRCKSNAAAYFLASISLLIYATSKPLILWACKIVAKLTLYATGGKKNRRGIGYI